MWPNTSQTQKKLYAVQTVCAVGDFMLHKWFRKFPANNFYLSNAPSFVKLIDTDSNEIWALTENDQHRINRDIENIFEINYLTVPRRLYQIEMVTKTDV